MKIIFNDAAELTIQPVDIRQDGGATIWGNLRREVMRVLQLKVSGQTLSKEGDYSGLVAGTKGYLQMAISYDSDWDGCRKAAVFRRYDKEYPVPIINGRCNVPDEITQYDCWKVSLIGAREGYLITTNEVEVHQG